MRLQEDSLIGPARARMGYFHKAYFCGS